MDKWLFSSESVTEGHPDKVCDQISDGILDAILAQDSGARVACESLVSTGMVVITGEISTREYVDFTDNYEWRKKSPLQGFAKCPTCNHILGCVQSKHKRPDGSLRVHTYFTCRICKCNNVKHKNSRAGSLEEQVFEAIKEKYGLEDPNKDEKVKVKPMEKSIEDLEAKKMQNFEKYKLGKMNRQNFIDSKSLIDEEIQAIKEKIEKAKGEKEVIDNTKLTRELMEKYIDSVFCEGNEVLNIIWK